MEYNLLLKISNPYILRDLFNYIKVTPALELIRYNKQLQNKLRINKKIYELNSDCKIIKEDLYRDYHDYKLSQFIIHYISYFIIYSLFHAEIPFLLKTAKILFVSYIFLLAYTIYDIKFEMKNIFKLRFLIFFTFIIILLLVLNILKLKYIFPFISFKILKIMILFLAFIIILYFIFLLCINFLEYLFESNYEFAKKCMIKKIIFIHCVYEFIVALKINILKTKNIYIIFDYIFLFINLHYIDNFLYLLKTYLTEEEKIKENTITRYFIARFKKVRIIEYLLPIEFKHIHNKMNYLNSISNTFKLYDVSYFDELYFFINNFREKNNVQELLFDNNFPFFILNEPFISLSFEECIFRFSETEYIFKYKDEFQINNVNREILLKYNLNRISFFDRDDTKFIYVFESKERHSITNYQKEYEELIENYSFIFH